MYFEGDEALNLFFMKSGSVGYVLPKYDNTKYIDVQDGSDFGSEDIVGSVMKEDFIKEEDWISQKDKLTRQFTVMADQNSELLSLSIVDLHKMQLEYSESYQKLIDTGYMRLEYALLIKFECVNECQEVFTDIKKKASNKKLSNADYAD